MAGAVANLWWRMRGWCDRDAVVLQRVFFPEEGAPPLAPNDSYLRLTVSELFLAKQVAWGIERYPVVQASARLRFGGRAPTTFATMARPPGEPAGPGVFEDYELTYLLPYLGQSVEVQVGLFEVLGDNHLTTALDILGDFSSLLVPPVSAVLGVMDKVASGIERVVEANGSDPLLALHATLTPEDGPTGLRPGWLAVIGATERDLPPAELRIVGGRLHHTTPEGPVRLTGVDYVVLRIVGKASRAEGAEWLTPDLDAAVAAACLARDTGRTEEAARLREEALTKVYTSPDFSPMDRRRIAKSVLEELASPAGAAGQGDHTIASIVARRGLPTRGEVAHLTLADLLA